MTVYLCHLALPAVVNRRLFQFNFVSRGRPSLNTVLLSSANNFSAYFSRRSCSSAFLRAGILEGSLSACDVTLTTCPCGRRVIPGCLVSSPDECELDDPLSLRAIGIDGEVSGIGARRIGLRVLRGSFLSSDHSA
jgi:hypothetical protein